MAEELIKECGSKLLAITNGAQGSVLANSQSVGTSIPQGVLRSDTVGHIELPITGHFFTRTKGPIIMWPECSILDELQSCQNVQSHWKVSDIMLS